MSRETTLDTLEPQPAKKKRSELRVPLYLPAGVVIPPFYEQEPDASVISTALQLGADAVCHLRSQAEQVRLQELLDTKASELTQRSATLEAELLMIREKADREVEQRVAEQSLALTQTLQLRNALRDDDVNLFESSRQTLREISESVDDLEKQTEDRKRTIKDQVQAVRDDERRNADADVQRVANVYQSEVNFLKDLEKLLKEDYKKRRENSRQLLEQKEKEVKLLQEQLREAQDRALRACSKSTAQGAAGEARLSELLKQAFGMAQDFNLRDTSKTPNSGDLMAHIWGLQTMWDCKNYSSAVPSSQVDKIKIDLAAHPEVDVAFLVALQTDIAGHRDYLFDVELVSPTQTLIYVNRLTVNDNPVKLLQVFLRPLLSALYRAKQEYTERSSDVAADVRRSVLLWVRKVKEQLAELKAEQKELADEKKRSAARYKERENKIKNRNVALMSMLIEMQSCS